VTRLDDLLAYEDDARLTREGKTSTTWIVVSTVFVVGGSLLLWWILAKATVGAPYALVLFTVAALVGLLHVTRRIKPPPLPATLRDNPVSGRVQPNPADGVRQAVRQWDNRLDYAQDDPRHITHLIQPAVIDIVDERLRLAHGISRAADPERAHQLIGPQLWKFITEPVQRRVTPHEMATLVAQMEAL